jgi:glycosyltransferase involved in cell wall biosynthesis
MKPRILHIISTMCDAAAAIQLRLLVNGLSGDQFDLHVCSLDCAAASSGAVASLQTGHALAAISSAGVPIAVISGRWKYDLRTFWELKRLVDRLRPKALHAWTPAANVYALVASKTTAATRFVARYGCVDPFLSGPAAAINRQIGKHCSQLIANSAGVREFHIRNGLPAENFRVIPSGVEPARPSTTTRRQLLAELGLAENSRLIGLIGELLLRNRVKDAIWAADLLKVVRKDVHLLIIGDGPHREQLSRFRDQVRIADFVHFLGQRGDLLRLMPHFDLLWSTSPYEDQSHTILEAMSAGVPVVACDAPGTRGLVAQGQTGFLVPIGDRAGFARHAHRIFEDPALSRRLGQAGQKRALSEFTAEKMILNHVEMYRQILEV